MTLTAGQFSALQEVSYVQLNEMVDGILVGLGGFGPWTDYTPTTTNITVGNGALAFSYRRSDKLVEVKGRFLLGSTSAMGTSPTFSLPVNAIDGYDIEGGSGSCQLSDATGPRAYGRLFYSSGAVGLLALATSGSYATGAPVTATVPFTWAVNDHVTLHAIYEAA